MPQNTSDPFAKIREVGTAAPNYSLDTEAIITRLTQWQSLCSFKVTGIQRDGLDLVFETLPTDMDAFIRELLEFCPELDLEDIVPAEFDDEEWTPEVLKRQIQEKKELGLWWD